MKMPSETDMRAEFHRLKAEFDAGQAAIKPEQDAYEAKRAEIEMKEVKELRPLADALKAKRDSLGLHDIQRQIALLSRALGGQTGAPPKPSAKAAATH